MKPESILRSTLVLLLGASALVTASCASPPPKAAKEKDYDEVYETGSNLPRRVPKKHADDAAAASQVQTVSPDVLSSTNDHTMFKPPPVTK